MVNGQRLASERGRHTMSEVKSYGVSVNMEFETMSAEAATRFVTDLAAMLLRWREQQMTRTVPVAIVEIDVQETEYVGTGCVYDAAFFDELASVRR